MPQLRIREQKKSTYIKGKSQYIAHENQLFLTPPVSAKRESFRPVRRRAKGLGDKQSLGGKWTLRALHAQWIRGQDDRFSIWPHSCMHLIPVGILHTYATSLTLNKFLNRRDSDPRPFPVAYPRKPTYLPTSQSSSPRRRSNKNKTKPPTSSQPLTQSPNQQPLHHHNQPTHKPNPSPSPSHPRHHLRPPPYAIYILKRNHPRPLLSDATSTRAKKGCGPMIGVMGRWWGTLRALPRYALTTA